MPELPEVEAIKLQLGKFLVGHKIQEIKILDTRILEGDTKKLIGGKIIGTRRFGKVSALITIIQSLHM
jgi:formamidopyrimidine-DNA glycosylase